MANLNQSNTPKSEKGYWRTPKNLIGDAQMWECDS